MHKCIASTIVSVSDTPSYILCSEAGRPCSQGTASLLLESGVEGKSLLKVSGSRSLDLL